MLGTSQVRLTLAKKLEHFPAPAPWPRPVQRQSPGWILAHRGSSEDLDSKDSTSRPPCCSSTRFQHTGRILVSTERSEKGFLLPPQHHPQYLHKLTAWSRYPTTGLTLCGKAPTQHR